MAPRGPAIISNLPCQSPSLFVYMIKQECPCAAFTHSTYVGTYVDIRVALLGCKIYKNSHLTGLLRVVHQTVQVIVVMIR